MLKNDISAWCVGTTACLFNCDRYHNIGLFNHVATVQHFEHCPKHRGVHNLPKNQRNVLSAVNHSVYLVA